MKDDATAPPPEEGHPGGANAELEAPPLSSSNRPLIGTGNALIFLTGADRRLIGSVAERARYVTMGALMLLTAGQAVYAAATIAAMGFQRPAIHELPFGLVYAAFILLIDRSILTYVPPLIEQADGNVGLPRVRFAGVRIRVIIAVVASILMSEAILLQFFAPRIAEHLEEVHTNKVSSISATTQESYQRRIKSWADQLKAADKNVNLAQTAYNQAYHEVNCQLFGCPGIPAGRGQQYRVAKSNQATALIDLQSAKKRAEQLHQRLDGPIAELTKKQNDVIGTTSDTIRRDRDMLAREEAFWFVTIHSGAIAFWRLLLAVLLLGIDLAPIVMKLRSADTVHDERIRTAEFLRRQSARRQVRSAIADDFDPDFLDRQRARLEQGSKLAELEAAHRVRRLTADLEARRQADALKTQYQKSAASDTGAGWPRATEQDSPQASTGEEALLPESEATSTPQFGGAAAGPPRIPLVGDSASGRASSSPPSDWVLGERWALEGMLPDADEGSYGQVWLAHDTFKLVKEKVVIKITRAANRKLIADLDDFVRQRAWKREAGARVESDHIGEILSSGEDRNRDVFYIVSPLYKPGSLSRYVRKMPTRSLGWCLEVINQVLAGLLDGGNAGLVHLDIKPGNIVLDGEKVRVIDWGLARYWERSERSFTPVARGSAFYASPEQFSRPTDWDTPLADLYSAGAVLYWLITGYAPYEKDSNGALDAFEVYKLVQAGKQPDPLSDLLPELSPELSALVGQWLSVDPKKRVSEGTRAKDAIQAARHELSRLQAAMADQKDFTVGAVELLRRRPNGVAA